jgi:hypothetical protein
VSFTTYYLQGNGQVEFTNKVFRTHLTKLVSENKIDWDEHLLTMLFSHIGYTPYQLVYGLHSMMPIEYIMLIVGGNERDNLMGVLTSQIVELEKLEVRM